MAEFAPPGRAHAHVATHAHVAAPSPEHQARAATAQLAHATASISRALEAARVAHAANDRAAWQRAHDDAHRSLAHATRARVSLGASADDHAAAIAGLEAEVAALVAPLGYAPVQREPQLVAILRSPASPATKELAARDLVRSLPSADLVELERRLAADHPHDPVAAAVGELPVVQRLRLQDHLGARLPRDASPSYEHVASDAALEAAAPGRDPLPVPELGTRVLHVVRALEGPALLRRLHALSADVDGTTRRLLLRRLEGYRPGCGDELGAVLRAHDHRASVLEALRAPSPEVDASSEALPHAAELQRAFGRHALSSVRAHIGGPAGEAARRIGARAFARGDRITFAAAPDLHTAAHEAAHVVQQRAGVVGADSEAHADRVADAVVRGESAEHVLDEVASAAAGGRVSTVQRKAAHEPHGPTSHRPQLAPGEHYRALPGQLAFVLDVPWFRVGATRVGARLVSAAKMTDVLLHLRAAGTLGWASPETLIDAAGTWGIPADTKATELTMQLGADTIAEIGLPPDASAMVSSLGDGLEVAVRAETEGLASRSHIDARGATTAAVYRALEAYTGIPIPPDARVETFSMTVGAGAVSRYIARRDLENLFGHAALARWTSGHAATAARSATTVARELTEAETARLSAWLASNLGVVPGPEGAQLSRELLHVVDEIEHGRWRGHRATILAQLRARGRAEAPSRADIRNLVQTAITTAERLDLGAVSAAELAEQQLHTIAPILDEPLPGHMTYTRGLLLDGQVVTFGVDFDYRAIDAHLYDAFAHRAPHADVEWVFERVDKQALREVARTTHGTDDIRVDHALSLDAGEVEGQWMVHAFVRTRHFPIAHVTTLVEVKSEGKRMAELRADVLGGVVAPEALHEDHGRFAGPLPFSPRAPQQRAASRAHEVQTLEHARDYLQQLGDDRHGAAIAAIGAQMERRRAQDAAIRADQHDGWRTFDVRATYLSKIPEVSSGPLDIYGAVRRETRLVGGMALMEFVFVKLRDLSRRFEQEDYEFEGDGATFEQALDRAATTLMKNYPKGRLALFAEEQDARGERPTGNVVGFERETWSTWNEVKSKVFDPVKQIAINMVLAAIAALPGGAPIAIPLLIANNAIPSIDDLVTRSENGTLTTRRLVVDVGTVALSVLPYAAEAEALQGTRFAMYALDLERAGNWLMFGEQVRETFMGLQAQDVAVIAQMYSELIELQKTLSESDPRVRTLREEIQDRAAATRGRIYDAFSIAGGQQLTFMLPGHLFRAIKAGAHPRPTEAWAPSDLGTPVEETRWAPLHESLNAPDHAAAVSERGAATPALPDPVLGITGGRRTFDELAGAISPDAKARAHAQASQDDTRSLAEHAQQIQMGHARSEKEMLAAIAQGDMPRYVARVGAAADFEKYKTFGRPDRAFTFATEPADLRGVPPAQALVKVGWTKQWMQRLVGQEVAVCILDTHAVIETSAGESHASVGPMDWPHLAEKALDDPRFLKEAKGLANISNREELAAVFQVLQQTPVRGAPNTADTAMAAKARMVMKLLDDHYSANDLFTGVGATMNPTGELGVREVMAEHNGTGFQLTPKNHVLVPIGVLSAEDLDGVP